MKTFKLLSITVIITLMIASCSKKYLDEISPADGTISDGIIFDSKIGVDNALTGIYGLFQSYIPTSGRQNMYGLKTIQLNFDMRGNDLIADPANWWLYEYNWSDNAYGRIATSARNEQIWRLFYKAINNANPIIEKTPGIPESDAVKNALTGEAKAIRAYSYLNLVRIYAFSHSTDPNAPGVPIQTALSDPNSDGLTRASVDEVYQLIIADLEFAVANMTSDRTDKYRINKNVAQMILAEAYQDLAMTDNTLWAKAISNAQAARTGFPLMDSTNYVAGFNNATNGEWMWALQFNASQSLSFASFFGYMEPYPDKARYNCIYVNKDFVNLFSASDARNIFPDAIDQDASAPWKLYRTNKFRDNASQSGDFVMTRSAESYLIEAEGLAQTNKLEDAKDALFVLQKKRDRNAVRSNAANKDALIDQILIERRKELYGEMGVEYFDLKRYKRPLARTGNHWSNVLDVPASDPRWRWQLSQVEMDANKKLTPADQNPL